MKRVKAFPYVFFHSLASISYYKEILKTKTSFSIKYFIVLAALSSLVITTNFSQKIAPDVKTVLGNLLFELKQTFPDELIITVKDNKWSINKPEPLSLAFPITREKNDDLPKNLITFYQEGTIDDLKNLDTFVLVNSKNIIVKGTNKIDVYPLKDIPNGELNKQRINSAIDNVSKIVNFIQIGIFIVMAILILIYNYVFRLIYLIFIAAFGWVLSQITGSKLRFGQAYRVSMHTITLPIVIELMIATSGLQFNMPFWFMFLNLIYTAVVVLTINVSEKQ